MWGDADIAFRPQERERLEATFTDHTTVIIKGAGTYVESDAPKEFTAAIRDWTAIQPANATRASQTGLGKLRNFPAGDLQQP